MVTVAYNEFKNRARLLLPTMRDGSFAVEINADVATLVADRLAS
jgi:hypothetical protein